MLNNLANAFELPAAPDVCLYCMAFLQVKLDSVALYYSFSSYSEVYDIHICNIYLLIRN